METIIWTEALSVGVERIDREHQTLVVMLNDLGQVIGSGQGQQSVAQVVCRMRQYAQEHFATEEEAMTATRYSGRTSHMAEHDAFIEKVLEVEDALSQGEPVAAGDIWKYLRLWLTEHIQGPDKVLGEHLCACGKG